MLVSSDRCYVITKRIHTPIAVAPVKNPRRWPTLGAAITHDLCKQAMR